MLTTTEWHLSKTSEFYSRMIPLKEKLSLMGVPSNVCSTSTKCEVIVFNKTIFWNVTFLFWDMPCNRNLPGNSKIINVKMHVYRGSLYNKFQVDRCKHSWVSSLTDRQTAFQLYMIDTGYLLPRRSSSLFVWYWNYFKVISHGSFIDASDRLSVYFVLELWQSYPLISKLFTNSCSRELKQVRHCTYVVP